MRKKLFKMIVICIILLVAGLGAMFYLLNKDHDIAVDNHSKIQAIFESSSLEITNYDEDTRDYDYTYNVEAYLSTGELVKFNTDSSDINSYTKGDFIDLYNYEDNYSFSLDELSANKYTIFISIIKFLVGSIATVLFMSIFVFINLSIGGLKNGNKRRRL